MKLLSQGLLKLMYAPGFEGQIGQVSPELGTALVESFNHVATLYAPKERYFCLEGHDMRTRLAILHHNGAR